MDKEKLIADLQNALNNQNTSQLETLANQAIEKLPEEAFGYAYMAEHFLLQSPPTPPDVNVVASSVHSLAKVIPRKG